jgi:2-polyprenyl-3-methyl-5-hydroxy-6-metoxy-1,4-benzoquinol methylase
MADAPKMKQTQDGVWTFSELPSKDELVALYADAYFQNGLGSYSLDYDSEELEWFKNKADLMLLGLERHNGGRRGAALDIGCGEGWLLDGYHRHGYQGNGVDFSVAGIEKWNPHLLPHFTQSDSYDFIERVRREGHKFEVISLVNVIEHVLSPEKLIQDIRHIMTDGALLMILAPNDFSDLQNLLIDKGLVSKKWWIAYPDHLSYFNLKSMKAFLSRQGLKIIEIISDNPVELNILSEQFNYIDHEELGPAAHHKRVRIDNFLFKKDPQALLSIYTALGGMGVGRNLIYYCQSL